jgi:coenzyme PQQ precursor peptide PqqA
MHIQSTYTDQEARTMMWEAPEFSEVRMDAELTAYADDLDGI